MYERCDLHCALIVCDWSLLPFSSGTWLRSLPFDLSSTRGEQRPNTTAVESLDACCVYALQAISRGVHYEIVYALQAISRGVHFEVVYAPMICDASARRSTITNANLLVELCRGKVSE